MRQNRNCAIAALALLIFISTIADLGRAQESNPDIDSLIHEVDQLYRSQDSYSEVEMVIHTPHWERTLTMKVWTEKTNKTLIRITSPAKEKGTATLRIGSEMWNYLPKTNKVIRIPPSMMMGSWMGSDFTNDDLVKEFTFFDDYDFSYTTPDEAIDSLVYINCIPHPDLAVVWGNVVIAVMRGSHLPAWAKYYDEDGELVRLLEYNDAGMMGGRMIPEEMRMVSRTEEDQWTVIRYLDADFDAGLDKDIFSLRALRTEE